MDDPIITSLNRGADWLIDTVGSAFSFNRSSPQASAGKEANALLKAGCEAFDRKDYDRARVLFQDCLVLCNQWGFESGRASCHHILGRIAIAKNDCAAARHHFEQCWASLTPESPVGQRFNILLWTTITVHMQGDVETALAWADMCLGVAEEAGDPQWRARAYNALGDLSVDYGDLRTASVFYEQGHTLFCQAQDSAGEVVVKIGQARLCKLNGDFGAAKMLLKECMRICRETGNNSAIGYVVGSLGSIALKKRDYAEALSLYRLSSNLKNQAADVWAILPNLEACITIANATGQARRAARLVGATEALRRKMGTALAGPGKKEFEQNVEAARERLGAEAFEALRTEGSAMTLAEAVAYVQTDEPPQE